MFVLSRSIVSDSLQPHKLQPVRFLCPWNFPGKNTEVGCHFLLQDMESYRLSLSHHCHMIFCSSSNFLHLCEVCKFPQLIVWIQQLRSILSNAAGWRWSLTPSGIKRLLSFSIFSQDIPLCWSHPHPYHPTLVSLSGGNRGNFSDCSLLVSVLMDLVRLTWCCLHDSLTHRRNALPVPPPTARLGMGCLGSKRPRSLSPG